MAYSDLNSTAKVRFLAGSQENIASYISHGDAIEGAFYLTNDTHRLYVGRAVSGSTAVIPVPVNEGINFVTSVADLSNISENTAGHFYYATNENILCVYNGQEWVQINPDTNDDHDTLPDEITFTKITDTEDDNYNANAITFNVAIPLTTYDLKTNSSTPADSATGILTISKEDINVMVSGAEVGLSVAKSGNNIILSNAGTGANTSSTVTFIPGTNISLTKGAGSKATEITVAASQYYVGISGASVGITTNGTNTSSFTDGITFSATTPLTLTTPENGNRTFTFGHSTVGSNTSAGSVSTSSTGNDTLYIPVVTTDSYGHTTALTSTTYSVKKVSGISAEGSTVTIGYTDNSTSSATIPAFSNYYTKGEIDSQMRTLNAMVYKGTVGTNGTIRNLPTISESVQIGDAYLVQGELTNYTNGDLVIATGTETDGYISEGLSWTRVKIDYVTDTTYSFEAANNQIAIADSHNVATTFDFASPGSTISIVTSLPSAPNGTDYTFNFDINWGTF